MSRNEVRCVKSARSQVTVGELYRWILAKLSDKDIKRALHKYRDLMPKQSDWNRKLTQATNVPELGFRYLYRCGQIDESNHRTMQKMLKYIDRQDVLPYFDTILYNTNMSNASIDQLQSCLRDKVMDFISLCDLSEFNKVKVGSPYIISQCQPTTNLRLTRSVRKRLSNGECSSCLTFVKKARLDREGVNLFNNSTDINTNNTDINELKFKSELSNETFASKVLHCLRQSRQRYRNIPLLHAYSLPGVIEAPVQILLQSSSNMKNNTNSLFSSTSESPETGINLTEVDDKVFETSTDNVSNFTDNSPTTTANNVNNSNNNSSNLNNKDREIVTGFYYAKIRVRIRMDSGSYLDEIESMYSIRTNLLDRQMDIIAETSNLLRDREAGEMVCELRCTAVEHLDRLWYDYQTGRLKKRLTEMMLSEHRTSPMSPNRQQFNSDVNNSSNSLASQLKLYIFINKHEYESCRTVLMRNLYPIQVYSNTTNNNNNNNNNANKFNTNTNNNSNNSRPNDGSGWNNNNNINSNNNNNTTNSNNNNTRFTTDGSTVIGSQQTQSTLAPQQRFSAVQHLIAHLREVPPVPTQSSTHINMWHTNTNTNTTTIQQQHHHHINVANRPVFMHMFYPQESYIPVTVNPLLRPIHLMSSPFSTTTNTAVTSVTGQQQSGPLAGATINYQQYHTASNGRHFPSS